MGEKDQHKYHKFGKCLIFSSIFSPFLKKKMKKGAKIKLNYKNNL